MNCPICSQSSHRLFKKDGFWIRVCDNCSHQFAELDPASNHLDQVYGDDYFQGGGAGYPDYLAEAKILNAHSRRYSKILARYMSPGSMLDVGAAAGLILQGFVESGWKGRGIEPNPRMAEYARSQLNLPVATGSLENLETDENFDLISMIQVVPHFFDLHKAFGAAAAATKPNGYWLIETWNRDSLMAKFFGQNWHEYSPPSVLHWFSPDGLQRLASQYGFHEVARGKPQKWINGAHVKSLLRYKLQSLPMAKISLKLLNIIPDNLPIPYPAEDLFWILLQKS